MLTAAAMALSQSLWWHSAMIEVYTLNTVLISAIMLLVFRFVRRGGVWRLYLAFLALGLGVSNHVLMGLYVPAFCVLLVMLLRRKLVRPWQCALMALCAAAGGSLYIFVFLRDVAATGDFWGTLQSAVGGGFLAKMFPKGITPGSACSGD